MEKRYCWRCGCDWPVVCFRKNWAGALAQSKRRAICKRCEITVRTNAKNRNRFIVKARDVIRWHARKYHMPAEEFRQTYDWCAKQIAHDFEHAYANGCCYCRRLFSEMANGLSDLSIDIVDRLKPPYYRTNVKIVCTTCNREKGELDPTEFAVFRAMQVPWEERQAELVRDPFGPLFSGVTSVITV